MSDHSDPQLDYESIVRDTQAHIRAYIAGMGVPRHDVDDIAQDVYLELYRFFDRVPAEVHPKQWLKGIARNLCLNYFRRTSRRNRLRGGAVVEFFLGAEQGGPPGLAEGPIRRALDGCYEKLAPESRRMLALRYGQKSPRQD